MVWIRFEPLKNTSSALWSNLRPPLPKLREATDLNNSGTGHSNKEVIRATKGNGSRPKNLFPPEKQQIKISLGGWHMDRCCNRTISVLRYFQIKFLCKEKKQFQYRYNSNLEENVQFCSFTKCFVPRQNTSFQYVWVRENEQMITSGSWPNTSPFEDISFSVRAFYLIISSHKIPELLPYKNTSLSFK